MQRYFSERKENDVYYLSDDDNYHIEKVMRMKVKDQIEVVDQMKTNICEIISLHPVKAKVIRELDENNELDKKIILVQSLVNENKMDFILQKNCELGVYAFYPYKATNSVIRENDKASKKVLRWNKIVKEASEQSKRNIIPQVHEIINLNDLIKLKADLKILLSVNERQVMLKSVLQNTKKCDTMMIVVGPEGGFTNIEEQKLMENGFIRVSIGKRVLRTETASIATLSMINYEWMVE